MRTTADDHFQDVRLISFDSTGIEWAPGDVLIVRPQNSDEQVDELFHILGEHNLPLHPGTVIRISEIDSGKLEFKQHYVRFYFDTNDGALFNKFILIVLLPPIFVGQKSTFFRCVHVRPQYPFGVGGLHFIQCSQFNLV